MELSLTQLFGLGAAQDINQITIQKSSLKGLSNASLSTPVQLFAALLNTAYDNFYGTLHDATGELIDIEGNKLEYNNSNAFEGLHIFLWKISYRRVPYHSITHQFVFNQYFSLEE